AGKNGCLYWNPFATNFASQPARNLANPSYHAGEENGKELTQWMFDPRAVETVANNLTVDLVFDGKLPFQLPGGQVGWAAWEHSRTPKSRLGDLEPIFNGPISCPCPQGTPSANGPGSPNLENNPLPTSDPNFRGCPPDATGPFVAFTSQPSTYQDRQQR